MNKRNLILGVAAAAMAYTVFAPRLAAEVILLDFGTSIKNRVFAVMEVTDESNYNNFFTNNGVISYLDIMALFQVESAWNIKAVNLNDGGQGNSAYGLGQMLRTTGEDMGYTPSQLLELGYSVQATMKYLRWIYDYLTPRLGAAPTRAQWLGAYNIGVGNVVNGRAATAYMAKINAAKITLSI